MTRWSQRRRAARGISVAILLGMTTPMIGCRWVPVRQIDPNLDPRVVGPVNLSESAGRVERVVMEPMRAPRTLPPLPQEPTPPHDGQLRPEATPLLDQALSRAEALQAATLGTRPGDFFVRDPAPSEDPPGAVDRPTMLPTLESPPLEEPVAPSVPPDPAEFKIDVMVVPAEGESVPEPAQPKADPEVAPTTAGQGAPVVEDPPAEEVGDVQGEPDSTTSDGEQETADGPDPGGLDPAMEALESLLALRDLARQEILAGTGDQELWRARIEILDRLIAGWGQSGPVPQPSLEEVMTLLAEARPPEPAAEVDTRIPTGVTPAFSTIENEGNLRVADLQFCRQIDGFGDYEPVSSNEFPSSAAVILYCEMEGVEYTPEGDGYRSRLESTVEVLSQHGDRPLWRRTLGVADDSCRHPRTDYYVGYQFALPARGDLPPGSYRLRLIQRDTASGLEASGTIAFRLREG